MIRPFFYPLFALLLAACAAQPTLETGGARTDITPREAVENFAAFSGQEVVWGGIIVGGANLEGYTRLEVLAYPLDDDNRPNLDRRPLGRFLVRREGYLELSDYAPGRALTVVGPLIDIQAGRIGEAPYRYPVVRVDRSQLWPERTGSRVQGPSVHFGIGVIFGN